MRAATIQSLNCAGILGRRLRSHSAPRQSLNSIATAEVHTQRSQAIVWCPELETILPRQKREYGRSSRTATTSEPRGLLYQDTMTPTEDVEDIVIVDLRDLQLPLRQQLLSKFYDGLITINFPFPDELDPIEVWEGMLTPGHPLHSFTLMHILLAFHKTDTLFENILGGNVSEYYPRSHCALLSFIVVDEKMRRRGLGERLVKEGRAVVDRDGAQRGEVCSYYFAETNKPETVDEEKDSMPPKIRVQVLMKLGFQRCDIEYVQPPLAPTQQPFYDLHLCVHRREGEESTVTSKEMLAWMEEYWDSCDAARVGPVWEDTLNRLKSINTINIVPLV
ncbi:hypothetical protein PROFUN_15315 [Planoprotostelium fungivorum]|uniref:N-acetyltransferase domain-containing protein n=1 Tax=Planoprotostelium fungivorum TaxID=1890364 RepID=A0A2P6MWX8_9EUKA|nr:hypothetical protein PROFUN_15315 [Planoprotostelium fungivorum]